VCRYVCMQVCNRGVAGWCLWSGKRGLEEMIEGGGWVELFCVIFQSVARTGRSIPCDVM
jgi:hypothetical protein